MQAEVMFLDEQRAKNLISESEYQDQLLQITLNRIDAEIDAQRKQLELNKQLAEQGIKIQEGQNEAIAKQIQALTTERAKAEKAYTDFAKQEAENREQIAKAESDRAQEQREKIVQSIADTFAQVSDLFSQIYDVAAARRMQRIEEEESANQEAITATEERINNTTGLEREYYERQLARYQQTQEQFTKIKEDEARKQALKDKAIAIGESVINTAVAVTKALASAPPPLNAVLAGFAGALGAAQTGVIIAQPFATGGKVGNGNISRQPNGDNVLATLKSGEVVLTEGQQRMLGGAPVFRALGVKGFADGGLVGAPTTVLNRATENLASSKEQAMSVNDAINAINGRIDRLQVVWTPNSQLGQDKAMQDNKEIKNTTQF